MTTCHDKVAAYGRLKLAMTNVNLSLQKTNVCDVVGDRRSLNFNCFNARDVEVVRTVRFSCLDAFKV